MAASAAACVGVLQQQPASHAAAHPPSPPPCWHASLPSQLRAWLVRRSPHCSVPHAPRRRSASSRRERKSEPRESRTSLSARADCCRGARRRADAQSAAAPGRRIEEFALLWCSTGCAPGRIPQSAFTSWRGRAAARQRCGVPHAPTVCVCYSSRQRRVPWSPEVCVCVFKAPRTYTPVLGALVSPLGTR